MLETRVLRKIFGPKRDEVRGRWRKLHKEFRNLYSSPCDQIKVGEVVWHEAQVGYMRNAHTIFVRKLEGNI
jgi:hypothetical protein